MEAAKGEDRARGPEIVEQPAEPRTGVFAGRNFRLFFFGQLISNTGNWLQLAAQAILVKQLSGSSFVVGATTAAMFLPVWFFALPGGRLADRFDRRQVLVATQVLALVATGTLALLASAGLATVPAVMIVAIAVGIQYAISIPTMQALLPSLVEPEQLGQAIGLNSITYNVGRVLGPALATAIVATVGFGLSFGLNSLSFVALIWALTLIRPRAEAAPAPSGGGSIREAVTYAWRDRRVRLMLVGVSSVAVAMAPVVTLGPTFARDVFHVRTADAGLLLSGFGVGAIVAALGLTRAFRSDHRAQYRLLVPGGLGLAGGLVAFALAPAFWAGVAALVVGGAGFILTQITWTTGIQQEVSEEMRGRVMGLWTLVFLGIWPLAAPLGGALADAVSPRAAVLVMSVPVVLVSLIGARRLRRRERVAWARS